MSDDDNLDDDNLDDELDEDLQDLLDQLDSVDVVEHMIEEVENISEIIDTVEETEAVEGITEEAEEVVEAAEEAIEAAGDTVEAGELETLDYRELDLITTQETANGPPPPVVDVTKYHEKLDLVTTEVLSACRADRQETQDVIDLLRLQIDDAINKTQAPARMWVDGLVKAVEVKAGINATAVKIIEANAKMLAATKAGINILNQNVQSGTEDLEDVLSRPLTENDEF